MYTCLLLALAVVAQAPKFERIVIDDKFPGGYQVELADVNGDGKLDVIAVGGSTCAWYENPTWRKHIVTSGKQTPGIISSATLDIDGDGRAEIAIGYEFAMSEPTKGKLLLASQTDKSGDHWKLTPVADLGSIHRLRWGDVDGDGKRDLVVAPIFGPKAKGPAFDQDKAKIVVFRTGSDPKSGKWEASVVGEHLITHAIEVIDLDGDGRSEILAACSEGVVCHTFDPATKRFRPWWLAGSENPKQGSSEVHVGKRRNGSKFAATIGPWHGNKVVVTYPITDVEFSTSSALPIPKVIDDTLDDGHALWVADIDGDGDDEIFAGHRGKDYRVSVYKFDGKTWNRTVIDHEIAAQDMRGGDLDGDGRPDVVAIGGKTGNVVWYRPIRR